MLICRREVRPNGVIIAVDQYPFLKSGLRGIFPEGTVSEDSSIPKYRGVVNHKNPTKTIREIAEQLAGNISSRHADQIVVSVATLALYAGFSLDVVLTDPDARDDLDDLREEDTFILLMAVTVVVPGSDSMTKTFRRRMLIDIPESCDDFDLESLSDADFRSSSPGKPFTGYFRNLVLQILRDEEYLLESVSCFVKACCLREGARHLLRENAVVA